jgi:hypothetical protein
VERKEKEMKTQKKYASYKIKGKTLQKLVEKKGRI